MLLYLRGHAEVLILKFVDGYIYLIVVKTFYIPSYAYGPDAI